MKQILFSRSSLAFVLALAFVFGLIILADKNDLTSVKADMTGQTIPFSQDWTNTDLITTDDDWSGVMGIVGFRGDDLTTGTNTDPRTILADGSNTPQDVIANQDNPATLSSGGVAEFDGIANPVVAMQGSGTADAPHIVIYLNTTGQNNIRVQYNARDIDDQTNNDATQQINTQYRVGGVGNYINLAGGYIADATTDGMNDVTAVDVALPAAASNQTLVEVRVMTTNASGSDEWIGIDDISVTTNANPAPSTANVDFNGDGLSDYVVTRGLSEGNVNNQIRWFINENGTGRTYGYDFGFTTDTRVPADYDGDGKDDVAVWRSNGDNGAVFYILQSSDLTARIVSFGLLGDDPKVVGDYDGDGTDDIAVYRKNGNGQNFFYYIASSNNPNNGITYVPWGSGEFVRPNAGDYDGDGKNDFCIYNQAGQFVLLRSSDFGVEYIKWGIGSDALVPGDYNNDGKDDFIVVRNENGARNWYILQRDQQVQDGIGPIRFGLPTDFLTPGDYDGDGRQDIAVWRPSEGNFYVLNSANGSLTVFKWGKMGDNPEATWAVHEAGAN